MKKITSEKEAEAFLGEIITIIEEKIKSLGEDNWWIFVWTLGVTYSDWDWEWSLETANKICIWMKKRHVGGSILKIIKWNHILKWRLESILSKIEDNE